MVRDGIDGPRKYGRFAHSPSYRDLQWLLIEDER